MDYGRQRGSNEHWTIQRHRSEVLEARQRWPIDFAAGR